MQAFFLSNRMAIQNVATSNMLLKVGLPSVELIQGIPIDLDQNNFSDPNVNNIIITFIHKFDLGKRREFPD